ncbi:putative ubiquitin hydrolase [Trypanosoma conorhini]|uniref:Putative ubiquitin hydrolase n=1 Tax=Trypanosoma conorhini TaxID=83891 RepID=A0A3R7MAZ0_9TRYP|nr:putative ubiquitin hydrolase [Trypanosoma conorhini]RNF02600.1 putative ubiquitin hydrolase [Trypanosoma conorhini]
MGYQDPNTDVKPIGGDATMQADDDVLSAEDCARPGAGNPNAQSGSVYLVSSTQMSVINGTCESPFSAEVVVPPRDPVPPAEVYVQELLITMERLLHLDDIFVSISKTRDVVQPFTHGVAVFEVPWFATMHGCALRAMTVARGRLPQLREEHASLSGGDAEIDVRHARELFVQRLGGITNSALQSYCSRLFPYRRSSSFELSKTFDQLRERLTQTFLATLSECPQRASVSWVEELEGLLLHDFGWWISLFFPCFRYAISSGSQMQLLWQWTATAPRDEVAFQVYTTATRKNLRCEDSHAGRVALFPLKWMDELFDWLCSSEAEAKEPPGPFDTFQLAELSPAHPGQHVVRADNPKLGVVPEELFELFWRLFGGGPKYLVKGKLIKWKKIKERFSRLKPRRVALAFKFEGLSSQEVLLEDVLHRAEVSEVMRRAMQKLQDHQHSETEGVDAKKWYAALCSDTGVDIFVTHVRGELLQTQRFFPNPCAVTVGDVLGQLSPASSTGKNSGAPELQLLLRLQHDIDEATLRECGVCGLRNIGNTCYMNSALQCLSNMGAVRRAILSLPLSESVNPLVTREMVCLLRQMWSGMQGLADTRNLKTAIGRAVSRFDSYEQQDAMEFIETLLDCMREEMNTGTDECCREVRDSDVPSSAPQQSEISRKDFNNNCGFVPRLFFFQTSTRLECLTCGAETVIFEDNLSLAATVASVTKRRTEVIVLLPTGKRVRLLLQSLCGRDGAVYPADVARELTGLLRADDFVAAATRVETAAPPAVAATAEGNVDGNAARDAGTADDGAGEGRSGLDGHKVIIYGDTGKPLRANNEVLCAAVVPAAAAPGQRSGEAAEEEAPENDGSDVKEEEEGEVYIWYFIRARGAPRSALGELCDVERVPAKVCSTFSDFVKHIMARREYLEGRYLKEKATAGVEVAGAALDPPRVQTRGRW